MHRKMSRLTQLFFAKLSVMFGSLNWVLRIRKLCKQSTVFCLISMDFWILGASNQLTKITGYFSSKNYICRKKMATFFTSKSF